MEERLCEIREWKHDPSCPRCVDRVFNENCPTCRCGCFAIAMFRNPCYDPSGINNGMYNYAEWLCAEHYDEVEEFMHRLETDTLEPWEENIVNDEETEWDQEDEVTGV